MKTHFFSWARVLLAASIAIWLASCATQQASQGTPSAAQEKVENLIHFDTASCQKPSGIVSEASNDEIILGGMLSVQPAILECFVPPQNRKNNQNIHVKLTTSVNSHTVLHQVEAENLSPEGIACIETELASLQFQLLPPRETEQTANIAINYPANSPQISFGINESSDVAGHVRLAIGKACHCYAPMKEMGVAEILMNLTVSAKQPAQISLSGSTPISNEIAACLTPEIAKLELKASHGALELGRVPLQLINSKAENFPPETKLELLFLHADGLRTHHASVLALRLGERTQASVEYNKLTPKPKARLTSAAMHSLNKSCENLIEADEAWVAATEAQFELDKRVADITARLRANDARWEAAANVASNIVLESRAALAAAQKILASDKNTCAKKAPALPSLSKPKPLKRRR